MKIFAAVVFLCVTCAFADPLKPRGEPSAPLTLVENGVAKYAIVIRADATPQERKAAEELNHWLKEITGADMKRDGEPVIRILADDSLAGEEYHIAIDGNDLFLSGGRGRGVFNAVYALLEEDMGCRFYTNDSIKLPQTPNKTKTLTITPVPRRYAPKLILRDPFYFASFDPTWSLRNRTNAPDAKVPEEHGGHVDYGGLFVHTHAALLPPDTFFQDHPDYFAARADGTRHTAQICPTHPDVVRIITENVLATLKQMPDAEIVSVSKNDNMEVCHCQRCAKLRADEGGTDMANQLFLVNAVAEAVEKEHPHVWVDTLAYLETINVPKTVRPRKNVIIRICNDSVGAWSRPFNRARELPVANIMTQWSAAHDRFSIWDYNVNFSHFLAPMPNIDIIADNIRFWVENHALGVMTQGGYTSTSERDEMRSWVIAKLMWDPSRDENALVEDFIEGHYGAAAPMLLEYEALLASSRKEHQKALDNPPGGIRYPMDIPLFSKDFLAKASLIFDRASEIAKGDEKLRHRVERAELPIMYVKLAQGPVDPRLLDRFERIARREKAEWMAEGTNRLDQQLDAWRKQIPASTQPVAISKGKEAYWYQAFPDMCRLQNGEIVAVFYAGYGHVAIPADDFPNGGRICIVRSSDEGKTWTEPQVLYDDEHDNRDAHIAQLDDGTLVCTFFSWINHGEPLKSHKDFNYAWFRKNCRISGTQMVTSKDNGKTWGQQATVIHPTWVCSAPVRQLPDGTCILGLYGPIEGEPAKRQSTGGTMRSTDRCQTWEPLVTIPAPPGISLDAETDIIQLLDGRLFAALRHSRELNMHFATSPDQGRSWTQAKDIGFKGHCPHLNRLSSGEIILCHRIPQTEISITRDNTQTWQGPYQIDNVFGAYPATLELKDKTVLIVYYTEGDGSEIRVRRFKLTDTGIEFLPLQ